MQSAQAKIAHEDLTATFSLEDENIGPLEQVINQGCMAYGIGAALFTLEEWKSDKGKLRAKVLSLQTELKSMGGGIDLLPKPLRAQCERARTLK